MSKLFAHFYHTLPQKPTFTSALGSWLTTLVFTHYHYRSVDRIFREFIDITEKYK